jgi:hypothetical protein
MRPSLPGIDTTLLTKVVRDVLRTDPLKVIPKLTVDELTVNEKLTVDGATALHDGNWIYFGRTGAPSFQHGWVPFDAPGGRDPAFRKLSNGMVVLTGVIQSGTIGQVIATLPAGFRPRPGYGSMWFPVVSNSAFGAASVEANGDIYPQTGSNVWFFLDGIAFPTQ